MGKQIDLERMLDDQLRENPLSIEEMGVLCDELLMAKEVSERGTPQHTAFAIAFWWACNKRKEMILS